MSLRSIAVVVFAVFALIGCGPSSGQIKTARSAQYRTTASALFQAEVAALKANSYKVKQADPVAGRAITEERWYEVDGTYMSRDSNGRPQMTSAGGILFAVEVGVEPAGDGFRPLVIPRVLEQRNGMSAPLEIKPDDPGMPGWVTGKLDNIYLSIYDALKKDAVAPATAPAPAP